MNIQGFFVSDCVGQAVYYTINSIDIVDGVYEAMDCKSGNSFDLVERFGQEPLNYDSMQQDILYDDWLYTARYNYKNKRIEVLYEGLKLIMTSEDGENRLQENVYRRCVENNADNDWHCDKGLRHIMKDFENVIKEKGHPLCNDATYFKLDLTGTQATHCNSGEIFDPSSRFGPQEMGDFIRDDAEFSKVYFKDNGAIIIGHELGVNALHRACNPEDNADQRQY